MSVTKFGRGIVDLPVVRKYILLAHISMHHIVELAIDLIIGSSKIAVSTFLFWPLQGAIHTTACHLPLGCTSTTFYIMESIPLAGYPTLFWNCGSKDASIEKQSKAHCWDLCSVDVQTGSIKGMQTAMEIDNKFSSKYSENSTFYMVEGRCYLYP